MTDTNTNPGPSTTLRRSADQKIFAGVCGGLGEHFGINAWWFRWAFIILMFFGFAGIALYILAWLLVPRADGTESVAGGWFDDLDMSDAGTLFGVVLIGVAALIVATSVFHISGAIVIAVVFGVVGYLLYRGDLRPPLNVSITRDDDDPGSGGPSGSPDDSADASQDDDVSTTPTTPAAGVAAAVATRPPKTPKPPKVEKPKPPPSMLGRLTMAILLIVISTMALVEVANAAHFEPVEYAGAAMAVIAVGLLVGAFVGRAKWLILIGLLLMPVLLTTALLPKVEAWSVGDPHYRPDTVEQVQDSYDLGLGQLTLDLTRLSQDELARVGEIDVSLGAGEMNIILPLGTSAIVRVDVGVGEIIGGVNYREVYGGVPDDVHGAYEDCIADGIGDEQCEDLIGQYSFDPIGYEALGFSGASGIALSRSYDLGDPPRGLVLELSVGAGQISIQQVAEIHVSEEGFEG